MNTCQYCGKQFKPDKYHPKQFACQKCQKVRQKDSKRKWNKKNPDYFKTKGIDTAWAEYKREYLAKWRREHKGYFKKYHAKKRGE